MMHRLLFSILFVLCLSSCHKADHNMLDVESDVEAPLDSLFGSMFGPREPGAVVGVVYEGRALYLGGFGLARLDTGEPFTDSTSTNIVSATKMFTSTAVMKLVEQGRLSLYQTLDDFFPDFKSPVFKKITIRNILSHTSGLPDKRPKNRAEWRFYLLKHESQFGRERDYMLYGRENEMIRFFETVDSLENEPGTVFSYQDPPFMLLKTVIEKAAGMPFEKYMADSIFGPAGMSETVFFDPDKYPDNMAHGYTRPDSDVDEETFVSRDGRWAEYDYGESPFFATSADRGIFTTSRDYFKWLKAYTSKTISTKGLEKRRQWQIGTQMPDVGYGLGMFVEDREGFPYKCFHMSNNGGFSIYQCYYPDHDLFMFVFSNRPDWDRLEIGHKIDDIFRRIGWI